MPWLGFIAATIIGLLLGFVLHLVWVDHMAPVHNNTHCGHPNARSGNE
jgi:hypothetical protein